MAKILNHICVYIITKLVFNIQACICLAVRGGFSTELFGFWGTDGRRRQAKIERDRKGKVTEVRRRRRQRSKRGKIGWLACGCVIVVSSSLPPPPENGFNLLPDGSQTAFRCRLVASNWKINKGCGVYSMHMTKFQGNKIKYCCTIEELEK